MNEQHIWNALLSRLSNPCGAAGLMGNLYAESALNPRNLQGSFERKLGMTDEKYTAVVDGGRYAAFADDGAGYGLAQWTYPARKEALLGWARNYHTSIGDLDTQLDFLIWELSTNYSGVLSALQNAKTVREASDAVLLRYERPRDQSEAVRVRRAAYGQKYYDTYADRPTTEEGHQMQTYDKYIYSTGTHYISNSGKDENNAYRGGQAGDQSGHEWELKKWYSRPWTVVLRYPDAAVGLLIARLGCAAALNDRIGYDQGQRDTYWQQLKKVGYDPSKITVACEDDCTAGVSANVKAAGALLGIKALESLPSCSSRNMRAKFTAAGFKALIAPKYLTSPDNLYPGDVLLCEDHHAATNVTVGKSVRGEWEKLLKAAHETPQTPAETPETPAQGLSRGDHGSAVTAMQRALLAWKPGCLPKWGADGDFGSETEAALKDFQESAGLPVTGVYDAVTREALTTAQAAPPAEAPAPLPDVEGPEWVLATGNVNVRAAPGTDSRVLGVLHKMESAPYQGEKREWGGRDWYLIEFEGENGWVSSKYAELTVG